MQEIIFLENIDNKIAVVVLGGKMRIFMTSQDLNPAFQILAACFAELLVEEKVPGPFSTIKSGQKELFGKEICKELETVQQQLTDGAFHLLQKITFTADIAGDLEKLAHYIQSLSIEEHRNLYFKGLEEEKSIQEMCGITDETLEHMYRAAKELYDLKDFHAAKAAFSFLTLLNPFRYVFWLGLANSAVYCQAFDCALTAYAFAIEINPSDPICYIYSSRSFEELKQWDNAINALDLALLVIEKNSVYADWKQKIQEEKMRLTHRNKT